MRRPLVALLSLAFAACSGTPPSTTGGTTGTGDGSSGGCCDGGGSSGSTGGSTSGGSTSSGGSTGSGGMTSGGSSGGTGGGCTSCPSGFSCGTANGIPVCRNDQTDIPKFTHVFVIMMENTSYSSLQGATAPYLQGLEKTAATSSAYSGVTDPSLPNYIALTSGDTQGIGCDCYPAGQGGACDLSTCSNIFFTNSCNCGGMTVTHLGDQLDGAGLSWRAYAESMGATCNVSEKSPYAPRHVPFLYYQDVLGPASVCNAHVVDYGNLAGDLGGGSFPAFAFLTPNLDHDMHGTGLLQSDTDVTNGDAWLSKNVPPILASAAYTSGGIVFIVWDEGDTSLSPGPVPFYVLSPLAKQGGYASKVTANHYSLLATIEDGLGLSRLGKAASAQPLADFFPAN